MLALSAFTPESETSLDVAPSEVMCPVRALRLYINCTAQFQQSEQLFVCFRGSDKGQPVSKQWPSHWVVDAIALAYSSHGMECSIGVRTHSVRAVASSWAWTKGVSIKDICIMAGWSSQILQFGCAVISLTGPIGEYDPWFYLQTLAA